MNGFTTVAQFQWSSGETKNFLRLHTDSAGQKKITSFEISVHMQEQVTEPLAGRSTWMSVCKLVKSDFPRECKADICSDVWTIGEKWELAGNGCQSIQTTVSLL